MSSAAVVTAWLRGRAHHRRDHEEERRRRRFSTAPLARRASRRVTAGVPALEQRPGEPGGGLQRGGHVNAQYPDPRASNVSVRKLGPARPQIESTNRSTCGVEPGTYAYWSKSVTPFLAQHVLAQERVSGALAASGRVTTA